MANNIFSPNYLRYNDQQSKNVTVVVQIDGIDLLTTGKIFTRIRYGDPHLFYGDGDVYGGMRPVTGVRDLIDFEHGGLVLQQRNEPEQGRAAIAQISMAFVDKDAYMTQVVSPGVLVPEILGRRVRIFLGYQQLSYPEDYTVIFRGIITAYDSSQAMVTLQFSDPNAIRRQDAFMAATTSLAANIGPTDTTIPVINTADFHKIPLGPDGFYDVPAPWNPDGTYNVLAPKQTGVRTFFQIDSEWIEYGPKSIFPTPTAIVQNIQYVIVDKNVVGILIIYTTGAVAGSEVVTVLNDQITIQIQSGVSTASQIITAVLASAPATALVTPSLTAGGVGSIPQTAPAGPALVAPGFVGVVRGARGTVADSHSPPTPSTNDNSSNDNVTNAVELTESAMVIALKTMLSANGPWIDSVAVLSIVDTFDSVLMNQPGAIILPNNVDATRDYGLVAGDYVTISGASTPANNTTGKIIRFSDLSDEPSRIIYLADPVTNAPLALFPEYPTSATLAFRSQFDTYPTTCSVALSPQDVDVQAHLDLKNNYLSDPADTYRFFLTDQQTLKDWIETQVYLPVAAYSLTRRGQLSVGITHPPIANESLIILNKDNLVGVDKIKPSRGTNNRKFFNDITWTYDFDDQGTAHSTLVFLDVDSISGNDKGGIGIDSQLPIASQGARTSLGTPTLFKKRSLFLLSRYRRGATIFDGITVFWKDGCQIEAGDIVAIQDNGNLKIANFQTGERNLGTQLFEVIDRKIDFKSGNVTLQLVNGIGADVTDRYATISPSSLVVSGSNSFLKIKDSFGAKFPGDEIAKWTDYIDQPIVLHDANYTVSYPTTIIGFDPIDNYKMFISGFSVLPGSFTDLIIDIPPYPNSPSKTLDSMYKVIHAFLGPIVQVVTGINQTQFTVSSGDVAKFFVGALVRVATYDHATESAADIKVVDITGTTITVAAALGFVPDNTFFVTGIGMPDKQGFYRFI